MTVSADSTASLCENPEKRPAGFPVRWMIAIGLSVGIMSWVIARNWPPARATLVRCAEKLLDERKPSQALKILTPLLKAESADGDACLLAAQACSRLKQLERAVDFCGRVPTDHPRRAEACLKAGDVLLLQLHRLSAAETFLREALQRQPDDPAALGHMAGLYGLCGFTDRTATLRFDRISSGQFAEIDLLLLALGETAAENSEVLQDYIAADPDDPLVQIAQGHRAWQQHDLPAARTFYERGLARRPDLIEAQSRLGRILSELGDGPAFRLWHRRLDSSADDLAEIWVVRGDWSTHEQDLPGSIRCYGEAARRDPSHARAHYLLSQALLRQGETSLAAPFQRRNADLHELLLAGKQTYLDRSSASVLRAKAAAALCDQHWEAWGWSEVAKRRVPPPDPTLTQVPRPPAGTSRFGDAARIATQLNLDHFSLPEWMRDAARTGMPPQTAAPFAHSGLRFRDDAEMSGLSFKYISGDNLPGPGMRIFQFTGGGVGVLDFDRDGWPDLYFTQGGQWPLAEASAPGDALFQNRLGQRFQDVSVNAGIHEVDYSQGLTVFDYDCDGWPDLFVANVASNRLFRNNGDGSFQDVTQSAGAGDSAWSTSAVGADFNNDGLPDVFIVNYLTGPGILERICRQADGTPRACTPHEFEAAEDQLLLNLGDGRFQDVTVDSGVIAPQGKGLGVLAADFERSGRLSLFVANDTTANFFFQNQSRSGDVPRFEEIAIRSGLAFDAEGKAQACMGIAADDADGNGLIDLFVTNYFNEANTLYLQHPNLTFLDSTQAAGLRDASLKQLGFGTQFLDGDLDGWPDLIVTNGHVDDETARGIPLEMPTQVFHNRGSGRFVEVPDQDLGRWFQGKYLGRGLSRLDWNRDGREDFAVSLVDAPAAILTNDSTRQGRYLAIELVGTVTSRDAIGAVIQIESEGRSLSKQLTAGDGYQASNERRLVIGVGNSKLVNLTIHWLSGLKTSFTSIPTDTSWVAIEGKAQLVPIHP